MAADRQRLAQALAAEAARRKMFESIPEAAGQGLPQAPERPMGWNDYLENLSIGLGRGAVNQMEGIKGMVTSPVETLKGVATGVTEAVRNPRMIAEALKQTGQRAMSGPLWLGEVIGENVNMMRVPGKPVVVQIEKIAKPSPQSYGAMGYEINDLRRAKQNFNSQYGLEEGKQFSKDYEVVNLEKLYPSEKIEENKVKSLMETMNKEGNSRENTIPPIIVDSQGNILDGHNRYEAAKRLGATQIPVIELFDTKIGPTFSE